MRLPTSEGHLDLSPDHIEAFAKKYPYTDVRAEFGRMLIWLEKNPSGRWKLPWRGIEKWLAKAETKNRARGVSRKTAIEIEAWWTSDSSTLKKGAELGLAPRPGESMAQFRDRVRDRVAA